MKKILAVLAVSSVALLAGNVNAQNTVTLDLNKPVAKAQTKVDNGTKKVNDEAAKVNDKTAAAKKSVEDGKATAKKSVDDTKANAGAAKDSAKDAWKNIKKSVKVEE